MKDTQECHYPELRRLVGRGELGNWFPLGQQKANLAAAAAASQGAVNPLCPGSACADWLLPCPSCPWGGSACPWAGCGASSAPCQELLPGHGTGARWRHSLR